MMSFFDEVTTALKEVDENIFYGFADPLNEWNYIVIHKVSKANRTGSLTFRVAVVRENYIDESVIDSVISAVTSIRSVKQNGDTEYSYVEKNGTNTTVEIAYTPFIKVERGC